MEEENIIQALVNVLPAVIVAGIAFYFFNLHTKNEERRRKFLLMRENKKHALPHRLQAYERMALFLERISPGNLLLRVKPHSQDKEKYTSLLLRNIEQEFEHNLAQQIYLTEECWNVIRTSKNATIARIRKTSASSEVESADDLRQEILKSFLDQEPPSETALSYIKKEVGSLW